MKVAPGGAAQIAQNLGRIEQMLQNIAAHDGLVSRTRKRGFFDRRTKNVAVKRLRAVGALGVGFHAVDFEAAAAQQLAQKTLRGADIENRRAPGAAHERRNLLVTAFGIVMKSVMEHEKFLAGRIGNFGCRHFLFAWQRNGHRRD